MCRALWHTVTDILSTQRIIPGPFSASGVPNTINAKSTPQSLHTVVSCERSNTAILPSRWYCTQTCFRHGAAIFPLRTQDSDPPQTHHCFFCTKFRVYMVNAYLHRPSSVPLLDLHCGGLARSARPNGHGDEDSVWTGECLLMAAGTTTTLCENGPYRIHDPFTMSWASVRGSRSRGQKLRVRASCLLEATYS